MYVTSWHYITSWHLKMSDSYCSTYQFLKTGRVEFIGVLHQLAREFEQEKTPTCKHQLSPNLNFIKLKCSHFTFLRILKHYIYKIAFWNNDYIIHYKILKASFAMASPFIVWELCMLLKHLTKSVTIILWLPTVDLYWRM